MKTWLLPDGMMTVLMSGALAGGDYGIGRKTHCQKVRKTLENKLLKNTMKIEFYCIYTGTAYCIGIEIE